MKTGKCCATGLWIVVCFEMILASKAWAQVSVARMGSAPRAAKAVIAKFVPAIERAVAERNVESFLKVVEEAVGCIDRKTPPVKEERGKRKPFRFNQVAMAQKVMSPEENHLLEQVADAVAIYGRRGRFNWHWPSQADREAQMEKMRAVEKKVEALRLGFDL